VKTLLRSFAMFIRQITEDDMLFGVILAPILLGLAFRFGVPFLEGWLTGQFSTPQILAPYYLLFDLFICIATPYFFCFVSVLVMLTEYDENLVNYLAVTPVGRRGYIVSRLVFPAVLSFAASLILVRLFALTLWTWPMLLAACALACLMSIAVALLLFTFSGNRVEGMALGKMANVYTLGLLVPFFIPSGLQYLFAPLPSFWLAKMCLEGDYFFLLPSLLTSILWIWGLYSRFERKLV
jgi:fluoroquinolone transport system permease protein